jgi:Asp-tRNA(Asn)/Glu-tRNA(Gln) amidotransferase A subunit family amidase
MTEQDQVSQPVIPFATLAAAEDVIGLSFTDSERELMAEGVQEHRGHYEKLRAIAIDNSVPPAFSFDPRLPGMTFDVVRQPLVMSRVKVPALPADLEDVAFWPVTHLAHLIKTRQVSSVALTEMYLGRLKRYDPILHCVVTLTEDLAMQQARRADEELASGHYRGPLHGIPWGAKDLLATRGIRTTWGAEPFRDQVPDMDATVVERLEAAGAVLVAKLSVGALAWGDVWIDGEMTRTPWNTAEGSSGSSAGSASATAAGLVGFAIGTETLGSIVSPATQCRVTGLRPTFGRISRHGAMALSWTMDKIGPMGRSVEDCALVFDAIYSPDGKDMTVTDYPFNWNPNVKIGDLRIGYLKQAFEEEKDFKAQGEQTLEVLHSLGIELIPISLPDYPVEAVAFILEAEAAANFDELTRTNRDDMLARQVKDAWPNVFRQARLIPAVEYVQASRVRTLLMRAMADLMSDIDVYVAPSFGGKTLVLTNLTGHPAVVLPNGVNETGKPSSVTFTGKLYGEAAALAVAKAYQDATDFHRQRPSITAVEARSEL